jgi:hypothetical protein
LDSLKFNRVIEKIEGKIKNFKFLENSFIKNNKLSMMLRENKKWNKMTKILSKLAHCKIDKKGVFKELNHSQKMELEMKIETFYSNLKQIQIIKIYHFPNNNFHT